MANNKFTPDRCALLIDSVRQGSSFPAAARCAGITRHTFANWRRKGAKEDAPADYRLRKYSDGFA